MIFSQRFASGLFALVPPATATIAPLSEAAEFASAARVIDDAAPL